MLHRRVGVLEVGRVQHRHAEELELRILVGDGGRALIVDDARGADAPQRRHAGVVLAGRELAALVFGGVALAPAGALRGDARVVGGDDAQRLDEGVAEIVERLEPVGPGDAAVGVLELGVAFRDQLVDALVVDHLIGGQDVVVVVDLDVALGDHAVVAGCRRAADRPAGRAAGRDRCWASARVMPPGFFGNGLAAWDPAW